MVSPSFASSVLRSLLRNRTGVSHLEAADRSPSPVRSLMVQAPDRHRNQQHRVTALVSTGSRLRARLARWNQTTPSWGKTRLVGHRQSHDSEARTGSLWCGGSGHPIDSQQLRTLAKPASDWRGNREAHICKRAEPPGPLLATGPIPSRRLLLSGR